MRPSTRKRPTTKPSVAQICRRKEAPHPQASQQTRSRQNPRPQALSHHQALPQAPRQRQQQLHVAHHSYNKHDGLHEDTRTPRRQSQRQQATLLANTHATAHRPAARSSPQTKPPAQQRIPPASSRYSPRTSPSRDFATHTERAGAFVAPTLALRYYRKFYSPSAFFSADTRRRLTGIFSSTPLSVSSSVPPATGSISSTMDRFTR